MLPYTPLHQLLLDACALPLVATSGNGRGSPILIECEAVVRELGARLTASWITTAPSCTRATTVWCSGQADGARPCGWPGLCPCTPSLQEAVKVPLLAVGAQQKNQLALAFGRQRIYSPYIGDLHSLPMQSHFEQTLATFRDLYDLKPELLVSDRHPGYLSHQWAKSYCQDQGATHLEVQHHHAHLLAVMAEHNITGPVLGVAFDGTGLGDDGTLWGGELLLADVKGFTRVAHLKPFKLIGGEAAIREPVRQLLGLLFESYGVDETSALDIPAIRQLPAERIRNLHQLWQLGRNAPTPVPSVGCSMPWRRCWGDRYPGLRGRSGAPAGGSCLAAGPPMKCPSPSPLISANQQRGHCRSSGQNCSEPLSTNSAKAPPLPAWPPVLSVPSAIWSSPWPSASPAIRWRSGRCLSKPGADGSAGARSRSGRPAGIDQRNPAAQ